MPATLSDTPRYAIYVILLSSIILLAGNPFLGMVGIITGFMSFSTENFRRTPDLIAMLSFLTTFAALMHIFTILPVGVYLLAADPVRTCTYSKTMVSKFERYNEPFLGATVAPGQGDVALAYPLNMTETAQGHVPPSPYPKLVKYSTLGARASDQQRLPRVIYCRIILTAVPHFCVCGACSQ